MRIGHGYDVHRLVAGRPLILGGVTIPFDQGLEGHSDGDALAHAIIDALLGAAALGDIGVYFPPGDPTFKNADSMGLLSKVIAQIHSLSYTVVNVDSTVICESPKLSPYFTSIRATLAKVLQIDAGQVSVKATTVEKLGYLGRGEAIAAQAVALLDGGNS